MHLHSISTLSSKLAKSKQIRKRFLTGLWIVFFLFVFDVSINFLFPYPSDPQVTSPGQLNLYFEYGRSVEGKLARMIGSTDESSAPIAQAGWLDPQLWKKLNIPKNRAPGEDLLVAIYGMSFSNQVGEAMKEMDGKIGLRLVAGPAAPPNYAFAAYKLDRGNQQADVAILGILASSVKALRTISGLTWNFETPFPFTYPRYFVEDGKLKEIWPKVLSLAQLRAVMQDQQQWQEFVSQMRENDQFFNSFLFKRNWLDNSAIVRLIRRAYAQRHQGMMANKVYTSAGFNAEKDIPVLSAIVTDFAATARSDGKLPIVLLISDRGYEDRLFQALSPTLETAKIPYVSTHNIAPATDIGNFVADGHFTESANKLIAKAVLKLINEHVERRNVLKQ
ncbi:MAG TPA: hypothetical protein DDW76_03925 [Cyanobacteria bacterium UBA11369]|nr:hypothetical protein [Cyanobacteria bacterium UBA11371]HBE32526.1 hypothetical protein [Cyanobacteria bacterium UBA11368]HBE47964.1 hypothetical protein [Cyanobacteria bacterium UBA11369]